MKSARHEALTWTYITPAASAPWSAPGRVLAVCVLHYDDRRSGLIGPVHVLAPGGQGWPR